MAKRAPIKRKRMRLNPAAARRKLVRERAFAQLKDYVELHSVMREELANGTVRMIGAMAKMRALAFDMLEALCPDVPKLFAIEELKIVDMSNARAPYVGDKWAVMAGDKVLVGGFQSHGAAWDYVRRHLVSTAQVVSDPKGFVQAIMHTDATGAQKSWMIH